MSIEPLTGEIVPARPVPLTPAEAKASAQWVRDITRAALTEGVDFGTIPGTDKPTLLKPGAEMLIMAAGLGFRMTARDGELGDVPGVYYKCTVYRGEHAVAECEAHAGYNEKRFQTRSGPAPWNTLVKMAQKRALVGAALNATAGSGLFIADLDDDDQLGHEQAPTRPTASRDTTAPAPVVQARAVKPAGVESIADSQTGLIIRMLSELQLGVADLDDVLGRRIAVDALTFDEARLVITALKDEARRRAMSSGDES